jgi:hypothetical protein
VAWHLQSSPLSNIGKEVVETALIDIDAYEIYVSVIIIYYLVDDN